MGEPRIIAPAGELDLHASRALAPELDAAAAQTDERGLLVDLSEVTFIDSTGLGALVQAHRRLGRQGRAMAVVAPKGSAAAVLLDLSGLRGHMAVFESRQAALGG
jgi:anti-sigma B factor antagonist